MVNQTNTSGKADRLKADLKVRLEVLEEQLKNSRWVKEKEKLQEKIDQLKRTYEHFIWSAEIDDTLARAAAKKQEDDLSARRAEKRAEVKNNALLEWIKAGGEPSQFESAWPAIEQSVMNERVINALLREKKPSVSLNL